MVAPLVIAGAKILGGLLKRKLRKKQAKQAAAAQEKATAIDLQTGVPQPTLMTGRQLLGALPQLTGPQGAVFGAGGLPSISPFAPPAVPGQVIPGGAIYQRFPTRQPRPANRLYRWSFREQRWKAVRRMNPTNVHALRRALRRAESFVKLERRVDKLLRRAAPAARIARKSGFVKSRKR